MNIADFINKFENHPVLFVGTGISLRYLDNSYTWESLIKKICFDMTDSDEYYLNLKNKYYDSILNCCDFAKLAVELEEDFDKKLIENRNGKFKDVNDEFFESMQNNRNTSRFKIYISHLLSELKYKSDAKNEIEKFKTIRKNISCIITTNYDCLLESVFEFNPLIGNNILLSNPYGSIYKIHGSVDCPNQIIITQKDYDRFENKYELIRAQLLSLFIHNPIIFIGYSISDNNIKKILKTIFDYVDFDTDLAKKIRDNFLLVEYDENSLSENVLEYDIIIDNVKISINKIKTNDFAKIYDELSNLKLPISAMDIRKVQTIVSNIYSGSKNAPKVMITENINKLKNSDMVLAIGTDRTIRYEFRTISEMMKDYFNIIEESNAQLLELIDKQKIQSAQYFPIYAFSKINNQINKEEELKKNQVKKVKIILSSIQTNCERKFNSIEEIVISDSISRSNKINSIIWNLLYNNLDIEEIAEYLKNFKNKNTTEYRKLLCIYDIYKYEKKELDKIIEELNN